MRAVTSTKTTFIFLIVLISAMSFIIILSITSEPLVRYTKPITDREFVIIDTTNNLIKIRNIETTDIQKPLFFLDTIKKDVISHNCLEVIKPNDVCSYSIIDASPGTHDLKIVGRIQIEEVEMIITDTKINTTAM